VSVYLVVPRIGEEFERRVRAVGLSHQLFFDLLELRRQPVARRWGDDVRTVLNITVADLRPINVGRCINIAKEFTGESDW
jgi:hypothetical protein